MNTNFADMTPRQQYNASFRAARLRRRPVGATTPQLRDYVQRVGYAENGNFDIPRRISDAAKKSQSAGKFHQFVGWLNCKSRFVTTRRYTDFKYLRRRAWLAQ